MQESCVFCDIVAGTKPGITVYDDAVHVAIMDKSPITSGHTLVMPRNHVRDIFEMAPEEVGLLYSKAMRIGRAVCRATGADGLNVGQNNGASARQMVFHVHVHLIPRKAGDTPHHWPERIDEPEEKTREVAGRIRKCLEEEGF